jgi:uncharacterized protein (TIGR02001 family)
MNNLNTLLLVAACIALTFVPASTTLLAQEVEISTGADVVSTYVFRGIAYDGPSIQPSVELSSGGFAIGAWGSQGLSSTALQEMDAYAGYSFDNGLYLGVTDYYYPGSAYGSMDSHAFEVNASFSANAFSFAGNYILNEAADAGSAGSDMYFELGYSLDNADLFIGAGDGWHSSSGDFALVNVGITTSKDIEVSDTFTIPVSGSAIWNPDTEQFYILVGFSF